nr:hypothetical protein B0A51_13041 [Rachicladosporium sp. CCFEE 5018]
MARSAQQQPSAGSEKAEMSSEHTPLLQHVPVDERRERYSNARLRRMCTIGLITIPFLTLAIVAVCVLLAGESDLFGDDPESSIEFATNYLPHPAWPAGNGLDYADLKDILLTTPSAAKAREWSQYYTAGPHLAGKNLSQAEWTRDRWQEWGVKSHVVDYEVYINYPISHRLALLDEGKAAFEATLEEDVLEDDPTTGLEDRIPVFHGYSASGNVTAQYVYANYGTYADFQALVDAGIALEGKIAFVKYGGIFRGLKVKRAEDLGMIGVVIYSDPGDDGDITEENGYKPYPAGPARNPSAVQRGSVEYLSIGPGDPTTIGYPSKPGVPRQPTEGKIPVIPSLPVSYAEALPFLRALNHIGPNATAIWPEHSGGLGYKNVSYSIGPSPPGVTINLVNTQEYVTTPLWNTIGVINGSIANEVVIIGNHRDAWIAGGAADPNSGSASLNEVIRSFGVALSKGWKPQRTIVFASWDGEEYGLIGSTEWVEEYIPWLTDAAVAYINVDVGAIGPDFAVAAAPLLNKAIMDVALQVPSPNQTIAGQTVGSLWSGHISTMGSGSDFTAFQDFAGIPSINVEFSGSPGGNLPGGSGEVKGVYHYHSNYDSFAWMDKYGDPGFLYHETIAKIIALLAAKLSEEPVISFNAVDYAAGLERYLGHLQDGVKELLGSTVTKAELSVEAAKILAPLTRAIANFRDHATALDSWAAFVDSATAGTSPPSTHVRSKLYTSVQAVNTAYKRLERDFYYAPGLDSRTWFKHIVFAPGIWTGYAGATFPGVWEALEYGDEKWTAEERKKQVKRWIGICANAVAKAGESIKAI